MLKGWSLLDESSAEVFAEAAKRRDAVMDIERAVEDFVLRGKDLFDRLRAEGQTLSPLGLKILRTQLHILTIEAARLKHGKFVAELARTKRELGIPDRPRTDRRKLKPVATCSHSRAIDDYVDENRKRKNQFYCLECGVVLETRSGSE